MPLVITPTLAIPDDALDESFVRASGPGGQNVNKVATAVQLRLRIDRAPLAGAVKVRLRALAGSRLTTEDVLVIEAREFRTQAQNRDAARDRLVALVRRALVRPKLRRKTAPTRASREQRLTGKARRSDLKRSRRSRDE